MKSVQAEKIEPNIALWELEIQQVEGRTLEKKGREEINSMLADGWVILSIYTLRFKDGDDTWLERPMAILGLPKLPVKKRVRKKKVDYPEAVVL